MGQRIKRHYYHRRNHIQDEMKLVPLALASNFTCFQVHPRGYYDTPLQLISCQHMQNIFIYISVMSYPNVRFQLAHQLDHIYYTTSKPFVPSKSRISSTI